MDTNYETTDVLICGCGPTGAILSAYLGRAGIRNVVLEKEVDITNDPRGIALDEDGIRFLQGLGLYEHIFTDIGTYIPRIRFVGGVQHDLSKGPFMCFDSSSTKGHTGHVGAMSHKQPIMEHHLRSKIASYPACDLRSGCVLNDIRDDGDWVYAAYADQNGAEKKIRARFLVGADGKTGFTRKNYLEPRGVKLAWAEETMYQETWVALNWKLTLPSPDTHPSFPLWSLGFSPEQVYDLFFPSEFRFLCNPRRPAVCSRFGPPAERLWRFEFVVAPGENDQEMAAPTGIGKVVMPYLTHPGSRYGLQEDVRYPADCIKVLRSRPYRFSARSCDRWALGRVIVCGDAAHVFPPFGGQGIASGFRDAVALSWRLVIACHSPQLNVDQCLAPWYMERKQQLEASLASTVRNGNLVTSQSSWQIFVREWGLWLLQLVPPFRNYIELGSRQSGRLRYDHAQGMPFIPELEGGVMFAQTYCASVEHTGEAAATVCFTDDVIFAEGKKHLFQIVVLVDDELRVLERINLDLQGIERLCPRLCAHEATIFVHRSLMSKSCGVGDARIGDIYRTASAAEFERSPLCIGRPSPVGYQEEDMWAAVHGKRYVILRQDRVVFAACDSRRELKTAAERLDLLFPQ